MSTPSTPEERTGLLEPDEPVLTKFSKNHELPLSTMISVVTHALVALVAFIAGAAIFTWGNDREPPVISMIDIPGPKGGGGISGDTPTEPQGNGPAIQLPIEAKHEPDIIPITPIQDLPPAIPGRNVLIDIERKDRDSEGTGGGAGGGNGTGIGKDKGPGIGTGGPRPPRALRMERWELAFSYADGADYLRQLENLKAFIAYPAEGKYHLIQDLSRRPPDSRPVTKEEIEKFRRIYWRNDDAQSLNTLAPELGLATRPAFLYVFFPYELEKALLTAELAHAKVKTEEEIIKRNLETKFRAERQGERWVVQVIEQKRRK